MAGTSDHGVTEFNRYVTVDGKRKDTLFVSRYDKDNVDPSNACLSRDMVDGESGTSTVSFDTRLPRVQNPENPNLFKREYSLLRKRGFSRKEAMAYAINSAREKRLGPVVDLKGAHEVKRPPLPAKKNFWTGGIWEALTYIWVRRQGIRVIPCHQ